MGIRRRYLLRWPQRLVHWQTVFAAYCVLLLGILRLSSELCRKSSGPRHHEPPPDEGISLLTVINSSDTEQPSLPTHFDRSGGGLRQQFPSGGDGPIRNGSVQPKSMNVRLNELERVFKDFDRSGGGLRQRFPSGGDDPVGNGSVKPKSMNVRLKELERILMATVRIPDLKVPQTKAF